MRKAGPLDLSTEHIFETDKAWAAGFFDGEGSVIVQHGSNKSSKGGYRHDIMCSISQIAVEPLMKLSVLYGGAVNVSACVSKTSGNNVSTWRVSGKRALAFIKDILPYSIMKRSQLELALLFPIPDLKPLPDELIFLREAIMQGLRNTRKKILATGVCTQ